MVTLFTSLRVTAILVMASLCVTTASAQQLTHRTMPSSGKTAGAVPRATKPAPSLVGGSSSNTARTGSSPVSTHPVATSAPSPADGPTKTPVVIRTGNPAQSVRTSAAGGRNKYLNVGVGLAAYYGAGLPLGASFEVALSDQISAGGSFDYLRYSGGYTFIYAGARGSYHLGELLDVKNKKFDPYAGATLGFRHYGYTNVYGYDYGGYNSGLFLGAHLGARYYVSDNVGGFAEVGYGISALKLGLTAKF